MTAVCVIDASGALALTAPSQETVAARAFVASPDRRLIAPDVFAIETRHALLKLERRKILQVGAAELSLIDFERGVELFSTHSSSLPRVLRLARQEVLGMYDALYLDLAIVQGAALASRDGGLLAAAGRRAVTTFDLR